MKHMAQRHISASDKVFVTGNINEVRETVTPDTQQNDIMMLIQGNFYQDFAETVSKGIRLQYFIWVGIYSISKNKKKESRHDHTLCIEQCVKALLSHGSLILHIRDVLVLVLGT